MRKNITRVLLIGFLFTLFIKNSFSQSPFIFSQSCFNQCANRAANSCIQKLKQRCMVGPKTQYENCVSSGQCDDEVAIIDSCDKQCTSPNTTVISNITAERYKDCLSSDMVMGLPDYVKERYCRAYSR